MRGPVNVCGAISDVYQFDMGGHEASRLERFKVEHRRVQPLDSAMLLLDNVVKIFNLTYKNRHVAAGVNCIDGYLVFPALVHRYFVWIAVRCHGLVEEALRRQHEILRT